MKNLKKKTVTATVFAIALILLLAIAARAALAQDTKRSSRNQQMAEGIVVPDSIYDRHPFSFAAPQAIAGEIVSVQTVDGVVVQHTSTDKYGRIFLAAGLPAGAYLISRSGHGQPLGKIEIQQHASDALEHPPHSIQLQNPPQALRLSDSWSLNGQGFSPNGADMQMSLSASGKTEALVVLAATEDQLKLAPVQQLQPGMAQLTVTNNATGQSTGPRPVLLYDMQGRLERHRLTSGSDQTQLVVKAQPENLALTVKASVASGPVDFGGDRKEAEAITSNGQAIFPVYAERGAGPFQLSWTLALRQPCPDESSPALQDKDKHAWEDKADGEEKAADKDEKAGKRVEAAEHREKAAAYRRSAGQHDQAAKDEEQRAKDYRDEANAQKRESDRKKLRDQAAGAEQNAAKDHESEAQKKLKCDDKKGAADEYRKAGEDYDRAADDYDKTHEATKKADMKKAAGGEESQANKLDPPPAQK